MQVKGGWERAGKAGQGKARKGRDGNGTWGRQGRKRRAEDDGSPERPLKRDFLPLFEICGAPVPTPPQSGPSLTRKCWPMVYSSMPNFIAICIDTNIYNHT